ncbi:ketopantoate reductase family protein [Natronorubrum sp. FCH18a]|uniref:ketopantoate reductase family protein n=1 Tax=Natronorubrum sp. FCH18a TaxID=3447018 RepID=UPI003F511B2D
MRIGIVGAGAMGGLFGSKLADAGMDVVLIDTWNEHVSAINEDGLRVRTPDGDRSVTHPTATTDPAEVSSVDVVIITVKTDATVDALEAATPIIDAETIVATFQNGFTAHETIPDRIDTGTFVGGTTRHGARVVEPGMIVHDASAETVVGNSDNGGNQLAEILTTAGFEMKSTSDIRPYLWDKQFISIGVKPTAALTGHVNGDLVEFDAAAEVLEELVSEADRVREAKGINAITTNPVAMVKAFCRTNPDHVSSALEDVRNHRKTEIEHINGAVARYGEEAGVPTPYNQVVTDLVTAKEHQYTNQPSRSNG